MSSGDGVYNGNEDVGDITIGQLLGTHPILAGNPAGAAYSNPVDANQAGDIWVNVDHQSGTFKDINGDPANAWDYGLAEGGAAHWLILHELGHTLGLAGDDGALIGTGINSMKYTVMSTKFADGMNTGSYTTTAFPTGLQLYDIAKLVGSENVMIPL